ncbi:MAG: DUF6492 family protein [Planctomycetota bacterium]
MKTSLVTISYGPDLARCTRLNESYQRHVADDIDHVIVVPRRDVQRFSGLSREPRTTVIPAESILPRWIQRLPVSKKWWLAKGVLPVRGWIMQQITKLSLPAGCDSDVYVMADSDVAFVRPFTKDHIIRGGLVRQHAIGGGLTRADGSPNEKNRVWHRKAGELLGISVKDNYGADYIGQVMPWRRDTLLRLHEHLERVNETDWRWLLSRTLHFSEGVIYGVFAEHVLRDESGHYIDREDICHCSWTRVLETPAQVREFLSEVPEHMVAVHIQSNLGFDVRSYEDLLQEKYAASA